MGYRSHYGFVPETLRFLQFHQNFTTHWTVSLIIRLFELVDFCSCWNPPTSLHSYNGNSLHLLHKSCKYKITKIKADSDIMFKSGLICD